MSVGAGQRVRLRTADNIVYRGWMPPFAGLTHLKAAQPVMR